MVNMTRYRKKYTSVDNIKDYLNSPTIVKTKTVHKDKLEESFAKEIFINETNHFQKKFVIKHINQDKDFLKEIVQDLNHHDLVRLTALKKLRNDAPFLENILENPNSTDRLKKYAKYRLSQLSNTIKFILKED